MASVHHTLWTRSDPFDTFACCLPSRVTILITIPATFWYYLGCSCDGQTRQIVDSILDHREAKVYALLVYVHNKLTTSPYQIVINEKVVDGFCEVCLDLDKLFAFPVESMDGLATTNKNLVFTSKAFFLKLTYTQWVQRQRQQHNMVLSEQFRRRSN